MTDKICCGCLLALIVLILMFIGGCTGAGFGEGTKGGFNPATGQYQQYDVDEENSAGGELEKHCPSIPEDYIKIFNSAGIATSVNPALIAAVFFAEYGTNWGDQNKNPKDNGDWPMPYDENATNPPLKFGDCDIQTNPDCVRGPMRLKSDVWNRLGDGTKEGVDKVTPSVNAGGKYLHEIYTALNAKGEAKYKDLSYTIDAYKVGVNKVLNSGAISDQVYVNEVMTSFEEFKKCLSGTTSAEIGNILEIAKKQVGRNKSNYGAGNLSWCAIFTKWVFNQAGYKMPNTNWAPDLYTWMKNNYYGFKIGQDNPQPGAMVFFNNSGYLDYNYDPPDISHVGIVESVNADGSIITIEGNTTCDGLYSPDYVNRCTRWPNKGNSANSGYLYFAQIIKK